MTDLYAMSDEEILAMPDEEETSDSEENSEEEESTQEMPADTDEDDSPDTEEDDDSDTDGEEEEAESTETDETSDEDEPDLDKDDTADNATDEDGDTQKDATTDKTSEKETSTGTKKSDDKGTDPVYEEFYKTLTKPFRANGKDMTVTNPDDMIALMQQGANYSQKMGKLKPQLAIIKTLEEHKLTDPADLSYLIDLHNKNPEAIAKLVRDSEIDIYAFDVEQGADYVPSQKVKEESPFETVVNELNEDESFKGLLTTIATGWDKESKVFIADNPGVLRELTKQRKSGMYDKIVDAIEYERMCGRLTDMPYVEAYSHVEQTMLADNPASQEAAPKKFKAPRPNAKKAADNTKKRKAGAPKSSGQDTKPNVNVLTISDEELMRMT